MIRHLNPEGFRKFGTILTDRGIVSGKPNHHSVFLPEGTLNSYKTVAPLWLGVESGVVVLSVSADGTEFADFYLDKGVRLKSGIWFRVMGFNGSGAVQISGSSMPLALGQSLSHRDFAVRPKVRVECLYTLFYQEKEAGFLFPGESHPMAELIYVDKGTLHSVADGQDLVLSQGDMAIYAPDQWHMQYADPDQAPQMVTISFWARGLDWRSLSNRRLTPAKQNVNLLRQIMHQQEQGNAEPIFSLLTLLLLGLTEQAQTATAVPEADLSGENAIIGKAQKYVQAHIAEKLTVSTLAAGVGVSASYLTALFHKHLAFSPGEYIRKIKLGRSKQLIREGQLNFTEISEQLQYSTVHHFSRQFKQMFGMSPTEYAKSVR